MYLVGLVGLPLQMVKISRVHVAENGFGWAGGSACIPSRCEAVLNFSGLSVTSEVK